MNHPSESLCLRCAAVPLTQIYTYILVFSLSPYGVNTYKISVLIPKKKWALHYDNLSLSLPIYRPFEVVLFRQYMKFVNIFIYIVVIIIIVVAIFLLFFIWRPPENILFSFALCCFALFFSKNFSQLQIFYSKKRAKKSLPTALTPVYHFAYCLDRVHLFTPILGTFSFIFAEWQFFHYYVYISGCSTLKATTTRIRPP